MFQIDKPRFHHFQDFFRNLFLCDLINVGLDGMREACLKEIKAQKHGSKSNDKSSDAHEWVDAFINKCLEPQVNYYNFYGIRNSDGHLIKDKDVMKLNLNARIISTEHSCWKATSVKQNIPVRELPQLFPTLPSGTRVIQLSHNSLHRSDLCFVIEWIKSLVGSEPLQALTIDLRHNQIRNLTVFKETCKMITFFLELPNVERILFDPEVFISDPRYGIMFFNNLSEHNLRKVIWFRDRMGLCFLHKSELGRLKNLQIIVDTHYDFFNYNYDVNVKNNVHCNDWSDIEWERLLNEQFS